MILVVTCFADWQPGEVPFMSEWGENLDPENVLPEYPRPQLQRKDWENLNGLWEFEFVESDEIPWGRTLSREILVPFPVESALSGIMEKATRKEVWYRKNFTIPVDWEGSRVLLHFGAVDFRSQVYFNNDSLGEHKGGYDSFTFDITDKCSFDSNNEIILNVYDGSDHSHQACGKQWENPESIWFTAASGIWQTVWLERVPNIYIDDLKIKPDVSMGNLNLNISLNNNENVGIIVQVIKNDNVIAEYQRTGQGEMNIPAYNYELWSPDKPNLYDLKIIVNNSACKNDTVSSYFGMRKIEIRQDLAGITRIFLNDQPLFHLGTLDQGYWPGGVYTAPSDEALKYDIEYTKSLGFNMIRKHIKVEPARWYYWCDKIGMMVWQDMPNITYKFTNYLTADSKSQFKHELGEMVNEHYNYPSIVSWVIFNENWGDHNTGALTDYVKEIDPTRVINSHSGWDIGGVDEYHGDINDMHEYTGPELPRVEQNRAAVCGEFGGLWREVEGHTWSEPEGIGFSTESSANDYYTGILVDSILVLKEQGLSGSVYCEITDVEREYAGFLTYDRKVEKFNRFSIWLNNRKITVLPITSTENDDINPVKYSLDQNYPNPFNPETTIKYNLPENTHLNLSVYNSLGQKVADLFDNEQRAGVYEIKFNGRDLHSGIYFYTLKTKKFKATNKMLLIK